MPPNSPNCSLSHSNAKSVLFHFSATFHFRIFPPFACPCCEGGVGRRERGGGRWGEGFFFERPCPQRLGVLSISWPFASPPSWHSRCSAQAPSPAPAPPSLQVNAAPAYCNHFSQLQLFLIELSGRLATADGSVIISQTTDGDGNDDARIVRVPAADWPSNSRRKIIPDYAVGYPRYVGTDRGAPLCSPLLRTALCYHSAPFKLFSSYFPTGSDPLTNATGDIPQVCHPALCRLQISYKENRNLATGCSHFRLLRRRLRHDVRNNSFPHCETVTLSA